MNWNEINNENDLNDFLNFYGEFHDCCLKELKYVSGAFVNSDLSMHAINDKRDLYIIFQRQSAKNPCVELKFSDLISLNLNPNNELYTCEILDTSFFLKMGIYIGLIQIGLKLNETHIVEHGYALKGLSGELWIIL